MLFGLIFALFKTLDLWYSKKIAKTSTSDWRFNPHLIWIMSIVGIFMGIAYVLLFK
ncbi:hypothetical protein [Staphylococcus cohnii]